MTASWISFSGVRSGDPETPFARWAFSTMRLGREKSLKKNDEE
jgi:hypothetical protein